MQRLTRTRLAPTPSGYLHLGNAYSFSLTAALAKQTGARIFLRIDDLDRERVKHEYVQDIFDTLNYLEIPWDEGPRDYETYEMTYSQVYRMGLYEEALGRLREKGLLFACDCSRSKLQDNCQPGSYGGNCKAKGLPLDTIGYNWRIDTSNAALPPAMQYFVVRKKDGFPAYQLASLVDDVHYGVDLIVRGEDLWESTLAQTYLARVLGYRTFLEATFHHHRLLKAGNREKLSKSAGAMSIQFLRKQGLTKVDCYRMIGRMAGLESPVSDWEELGAAGLK